jgi:hypothetical protein
MRDAAPPSRGEIASVACRTWSAHQDIRIERKHDVRCVELVVSVHEPAKGELRAGARRMRATWVVLVPLKERKRLLELGSELPRLVTRVFP